jgi:hypothetical protein
LETSFQSAVPLVLLVAKSHLVNAVDAGTVVALDLAAVVAEPALPVTLIPHVPLAPEPVSDGE